MARENQGLQIALIIFVFLFLICAVLAFLFGRQAAEQATAAKAAEEAKAEAETTANKIQTDFNTVKEYLGVDKTAPIETISDQYTNHMTLYAANLPEGQKSYIKALEDLAETLDAKNASLASEIAAKENLATKLEQLEEAKKPLVAREQERAEEAQAQLASATKTYNEARAQLTEQAENQLQTFQQRTQAAAAQQQQLKDEIAAHENRIQEIQDRLATSNEKIENILDPTFEMADGKVRWVNQRNETVWINLGRGDALQELISFSVYPADTNDVTEGSKKGSIEVTQVLEAHLAEARIVENEPGNPIMPGDVIYTPVWAPGEREHFALTDGMDIDADGRSDVDTVIRIIRLNGGVVDTWLTDDGTRHGSFTDETRFLVLGDRPDETDPKERLEARKNFLNDARGRAITEIQLTDLLNRMGWKNATPVVRHGRGFNPADFRAQPPEEGVRTSPGTVSPLFQPRDPPRARDTAY